MAINLRLATIATLTAAALVGSLSYLALYHSGLGRKEDEHDDDDDDQEERSKKTESEDASNLNENVQFPFHSILNSQYALIQERVALGNAAKVRGNKFFHASQLKEAIECYTEAISFYPESYKEASLAYANRAACNLALVPTVMLAPLLICRKNTSLSSATAPKVPPCLNCLLLPFSSTLVRSPIRKGPRSPRKGIRDDLELRRGPYW